MTSTSVPVDNTDDLQSPKAPPISPITPAAQFAIPVTNNFSPDQPTSPRTVPPARPDWHPADQSEFIAQPSSVAIPEDENVDAIALRAAIYTLEIQKQKSLRDIKTLQKLKAAAAENPERFLDEYTAGRLKHERAPGDALSATFEADDSDDEEEEETSQDTRADPFPAIPSRQNVVRCPPVNWAKYEIIGAPLDRLHEAQRLRPTAGEPAREGGQFLAPAVPNHAIFAPHDPLKDRLENVQSQSVQPIHPMITRKSSTRP